MKKFLIILMVAFIGMTMTGCIVKTKATVDVKVVNRLGVAQSGQTVYMFEADDWDASFRTPAHAEKSIVTDEEGMASFNIQGIYLDVLDGQATLYFAVFDKEGKEIEGYKATTVKAGDQKSLEITI